MSSPRLLGSASCNRSTTLSAAQVDLTAVLDDASALATRAEMELEAARCATPGSVERGEDLLEARPRP